MLFNFSVLIPVEHLAEFMTGNWQENYQKLKGYILKGLLRAKSEVLEEFRLLDTKTYKFPR